MRLRAAQPSCKMPIIPVILGCLLWVLCFVFFLCDGGSLEKTRVAIALLIAWLIDQYLYAVAVAHATTFRHFVPAIVVVSLYSGYLAWRVASVCAKPLQVPDDSIPVRLRDLNNVIHTSSVRSDVKTAERLRDLHLKFAAFAALLLAIFLMVYVVSPLENHYFGPFWHAATSWNPEDSDPEHP